MHSDISPNTSEAEKRISSLNLALDFTLTSQYKNDTSRRRMYYHAWSLSIFPSNNTQQYRWQDAAYIKTPTYRQNASVLFKNTALYWLTPALVCFWWCLNYIQSLGNVHRYIANFIDGYGKIQKFIIPLKRYMMSCNLCAIICFIITVK